MPRLLMTVLQQRVSFVDWCVKPFSWWRSLLSPTFPQRKHNPLWVRITTLPTSSPGGRIHIPARHPFKDHLSWSLKVRHVWHACCPWWSHWWQPPNIQSATSFRPHSPSSEADHYKSTENAHKAAFIVQAFNICMFKDRTQNGVSNN